MTRGPLRLTVREPQEFAKATFHMFILHSAKAPARKLRLFNKSDRAIFMQVYNYLRADYLSRARFRPRFASSDSDRHDEEYFLQSLGWREMVLSVVSIRVDYKVPEAYPGKEEVCQTFSLSAMSQSAILIVAVQLRRIRAQDLGT